MTFSFTSSDLRARGRPTTFDRLLAAGAALVVFVVAIVATAGPASAHAVPVREEPVGGAVLTEVPPEIRLFFNEAVSPTASSVEIIAADGSVIEPLGLRSAEEGSALVVDLPALDDGVWRLRWTVFSESDGHITSGAVIYGVGSDADLAGAALDDPVDPTDPVEVALRWVVFAGGALVLGGLGISGFILPRAASRSPRLVGDLDQFDARVREWAVRSTVAVLVASILLIGWQLLDVVRGAGLGIALDILPGSTWGQLWMVRLLLVTLAWAWARRWLSGTVGGEPLAALVVAIFVMQAFSGHAAGTERGFFAVVVQVVHLVATGGWMGAVLLVGAARPARAARQSVLAALAPYAWIGVLVTVITGLFATGSVVRSVDAALFSGYGQVLLVKVVAVTVIVGLGAWANGSLRSPASGSGFLRAEAIGGLLAFGLAAALTASVPPTGARWEPRFDESDRELASLVTDVIVGVTISPNQPGENLITVKAASTRRPEPAPIERVLVRLAPLDGSASSTTIEVADNNASAFEAVQQLAVAGEWEVEVVVRRAGLEDVVAPFRWSVGSGPGHPVSISDRPLAPLGDRAASLMVLALAVSALTAFVVLRRRHWTAGLDPVADFEVAAAPPRTDVEPAEECP